MALPKDEELDPLVINETPRPTGEVIQEGQAQAAPNSAPTPAPQSDEPADPFEPSAPQPQTEAQATPSAVPSPTRVSGPSPTIAETAASDVFTPKTIAEPHIFHRRASDPDVEAQQQADEQRRAQDMQRTAQKEENKRAATALKGLKASGVEVEVDPATGLQRPKLDVNGQPVYKPAVLDPWHVGADGSVSQIKRDYQGNTVSVPLKPRLDPVTGQKYVVSADGTERQDLGVDESFLQRKSMTLAGQAAAVAKSQVTSLTTQAKALQKQRDDIVSGAADLDPNDKSTDVMLKRKQIQIDRAKIDTQLQAIVGQKIAAQTAYSSAQSEYVKQKQAFIDSSRAKAGLPPLNSPQAPDGQQPATSPPAAIVATVTAVSQDPVGFVERVKEMWKNKEFVPYLGTGIEIKHLLELGAAGQRLLAAEKAGTTGAPQDAQLVADYLQRANRPDSGWAKVASIVGQSASFGGELGLASLLGTVTAGAGGVAAEGEALAARAAAKAAKVGLDVLAERSARNFLTRQIGKVLGPEVADKLAARASLEYAGHAAERLAGMEGFGAAGEAMGANAAAAKAAIRPGLAGTLGEIAAKTGGKVVQAALQTPIASPLRIAAQVIQDRSPVKMSMDDAGKISVMANDERDGFVHAIGNATLSNYIENLSEFSGGVFKYIPAPKAVTALKAAILTKLQMAGKLAPFAAKIASATNRTAQLAHWHGVLPEIGEEYIGGAMHAAVGQGTWKDQIPGLGTAMDEGIGPALQKDILPMAAAFLVPGTLSNVSRATANWIGKMRKGEQVDNLDPADEAAILKDLADAGATTAAMTPEGQATNRQMIQDEHDSVTGLINDPTTPAEQKAALIQRRDELAAQLQGGETTNANATNEETAIPTPTGAAGDAGNGGPVQNQPQADATQGQTQGAQDANGQPVGGQGNDALLGEQQTTSVPKPGGAGTSKPSTEGPKQPAPKVGTRIAGPALVQDGKVVEQGKVVDTHADLIGRAAARGVDATAAEHAFTDEHGNILSRTEAAPIAEKAGQRRKGTSGPLHSQHLTDSKTNPSDGEAGEQGGATSPKKPAPPAGDGGATGEQHNLPPESGSQTQGQGEGNESSAKPNTGQAERHFREALTKGRTKAVLDALGVTINKPTADALNFRAAFKETGGKVEYSLDHNPAHTDERTKGMSDDEARAYVEASLGEEITHFAQFEAVRRAWQKATAMGAKAPFAAAWASAYAGVSKAMTVEERKASGDAYGDGWDKLSNESQAAEFVRQLLQRKRLGTITEATIRAKPIIERILAVLDELLKKIKNAPEALRHAYERTAAILAEIVDGEKPAAEATSEKRSSTQLDLPADAAKQITDFGKTIDPADLYHGDGEADSYGPEYGLEDKPHITALYGLDTQDAADVAKHVAGHGTVAAKLGPVTAFHDDKYDVLKVDVLPGEGNIHDLNAKLREMPHKSDFPDYHPHVTVAYLKPGTAAKYEGAKTFSGKPLVFDKLTFSNAEREHTAIPLTGKTETAEKPPKPAPAPAPAKNLPTAKQMAAIRSRLEIAREAQIPIGLGIVDAVEGWEHDEESQWSYKDALNAINQAIADDTRAKQPKATPPKAAPAPNPAPKVDAPKISDQASRDLDDAFEGLESPSPDDRPPTFYSQLVEAVRSIPQATMTIAQARAAIEKGAKPDEIKASGILDDPLSPLAGRPDNARVTRYELTDYAVERQTKVQDVVLGGKKDADPDAVKSLVDEIEPNIGTFADFADDEYYDHAFAVADDDFTTSDGLHVNVDEPEAGENGWKESGGWANATVTLPDGRKVRSGVNISRKGRVETYGQGEWGHGTEPKDLTEEEHEQVESALGQIGGEMEGTLNEELQRDSDGYDSEMRDAIKALKKGDLEAARDSLETASRIERTYGDDPTVSPLIKKLREIINESAPETQFEQFQTPGAEPGSYREMFVTWPDNASGYKYKTDDSPEGMGKTTVIDPEGRTVGTWATRQSAIASQRRQQGNWEDGHGQYSDIANPVVRIRRNLRRDDEGRLTYFIEEMQGPGKAEQAKMPEEVRKRIYEIGMKRAIRDAVDSGADAIAWTNGAQQADRYSLEKQVKSIQVGQSHDGTYSFRATDLDGRVHPQSGLTEEQLAANIGKDLAAKAVEDLKTEATKVYDGVDLKFGGEGLARLYDRTLPAIANKLASRVGGHVATAEINVAEKQDSQYAGFREWLDTHNLPNTAEQASDEWLNNGALAREYRSALDDDKVETVHSMPIPDAWLDKAPTFALYSADPVTQEELPAEKIGAFVKAAQSLIASGIETPDSMAHVLETKFNGKFRKYSEALWDAFGMAKKSLRGTHDWNAVYAAIDQAAKPSEGEAANEPDANTDGSPETGEVRPLGGRAGGGHSGEQAGTGERDTETDAGVLEGGAAGNVEGTGDGGHSGKAGAGAGGQGGATDQEQPGGGDESDGRPGGSGEGLVPDGARGSGLRGNYELTDPEKIQGGGPKARFARNRKAIETYQTVSSENREPTPEELDTIAGYMGWGSFGQELFKGNWNFPQPKPDWKAEDKWLREALTQTEWEGIQRSITNAHYTSPPVVSTMWDMARRMGFDGGRVLEPSIGIGNFFGLMPRDIMTRSQLTGIDMDKLVAGMAAMLYPETNIQAKGYQDSKTADNFYDFIIGNWPFAKAEERGFADRRYQDINPSLHDYFFLKALDQVRPGGIVMGITSSGTMDKKGAGTRLALARKADLIGAFRFPTGAFKNYAGTDVVTDLLIFRKRGADEAPQANAPKWRDAVEIDTGNGKITVNEYFANNQKNVLGALDFGHGTFGRAGMIVNMPADFEAQLTSLKDRVPVDGYRQRENAEVVKHITNNTTDRQGSVVDQEGGLFVVRGEHLTPLDDIVKYKVKSAKSTLFREKQIRALVTMRRVLGTLLDQQRNGDEGQEKTRELLRKHFEAFRKENGPVNTSEGLAILRKAGDHYWTSLAALERNTASHGEAPKYEGSTILVRSTARGAKKLSNPSIQDAYVLHRNETLDISPERIAEMANTTKDKVVDTLTKAGAIFQTPTGTFEPREIYLSGNVRRKLEEAEAAKADGQAMDANIEALKAVVPKDTPYFNIEAKLGNTWTTADDYGAFVSHLLNLPAEGSMKDKGVEVVYGPGGWVVRLSDALKGSTAARATWGVDYKGVGFNRVLTAAMNNQTLTVWGRDDDGNKFVKETETKIVNAKIEKLREEFEKWVWKDPQQRVRLEKAYNNIFNAVATPNFDGSFLSFDGMALERGEGQFGLRKHQQDAIWRGVVMGRGLYAHEVGTGKTYTMAGVAVESRRYGKARKPLVFAHNANSMDVYHSFQEMYPGAKVLYVDNLDPENRARTMAQIQMDDWDAVIVPHSLIDRFTLKAETLEEISREEIADLEAAALDAASEDGVALDIKTMDDPEAMKKVRSATAKELVKQRQKIKQRIAEAALKANTDAIFFEDLGVDQLIIDEAHIFKKPPIASKMVLRGLNKAGSGRSINLFFLTEYLNRQNGGTGVHLFTGTPITNTLNEIFNMQRYVMNDILKRDGVSKWDAWFNTFADSVTDAELSPAGDFESVTRLAAFVNVAEMRRMIGEFMDVVFAKNMPEMADRETASGKTLKSPDLTEAERAELMDGRRKNSPGRPYRNVRIEVAEMSDDQKRIRLLLAERAKTFRGASKKQRWEIMKSGGPESPVIVETDAANAGLDARLYDPKLPDDPNSKVNRCVTNILRHYETEDRAAQVVFMERGYSDLKTKSQGRDRAGNKLPPLKVQGFNLAAELVRKLVDGGIPEDQIAIVNGDVSGKKRKEIADKMNTGEIRVVIGLTNTLGTGVNMQTNLRAMHHLDAPWTPGELEQRNGRGWRQGNEWNTVLEYRYITEGIDGRRWQVLSIKDRFIKAFLEADENTRVIEGDSVSMDEGESISDIAETFGKAAGDPRLIIQAKLRKDVEKLRDRERTHVAGVAEMEGQLANLDRSQEYNNGLAAAQAKDAQRYADNAQQPFSITIGKETFTDREKADEALAEIATTFDNKDKHKEVGRYRGFVLTGTKSYGDPVIEMGGVMTHTAKPSLGSMDSNLRFIKTEAARSQERADAAKASRAGLVNSINTPFGRLEELRRKEKQLDDLSKDIQLYPAPAPAWLREGAPTDTDVYVDGKKRLVKGQRWSRTNYFVLLDGPDGIDPVPYTNVTDENNIPIFEPRPFEKPVSAAGNNKGPTTPNGWKAGDKFDWGYKGNTYQITDVVAPAQADINDLSKWKFQAENVKTGRGEILAADDTNITRVKDEEPATPPDTGLQSPDPDTSPEGKTAGQDQSPAEQPPSLHEVLRSAFEGLPPKEKIVVRMRMAKASDDEIAAAAGLTTAAVERAYRMGLGKLNAAKAGLANIGKRFEEAKAAPDGQRTIGRPDLANVPSGDQSRKLVDVVDDLRSMAGTPERKSDEETSANAQAQWDKLGAKGVERMLFEAVKARAPLSDEQTILAKRLVSQVALTAVRMKDQDKMLHAAMVIDAYRDTGTEWGRAGRQRRDAYATPEERLRQYIGEALLTPDARRRKRLADAKTPEAKEDILKEWIAKVEELKRKLAALGFDLDRMSDEQLVTRLKNRSKAREIVSTIATAKADGWDALYEYWVSSILSAPATNVANLAGNFGNAAWDFTAQRFTEAAVNTLVRDKGSAQFGEFQWLARGIIPGIGRAWNMARQAWTSESPTFQEEIQGEAGSMKFENQRVHAIPGRLGRIVRVPLRFLLAADEFSKALFGTMQVHAEAYRIAKAEKLTGAALSKRIQQLATPQHEAIAAIIGKVTPPAALVEAIANRIAARRGVDAKDLIRDKNSMAWTMARERTAFDQITNEGWRPDAWNGAIKKAVDLAFQDELGPLGKGIVKIRNDVAGLRYFMPFIQTIANIFKTGIRKSPLGSAALLYRVIRSGFVRMNWSGKEWSYTRTQFVQHSAEQLLGWGVMIGLASLVKPPPDDDFPFITGSSPFKGTKKGARDLAYRTAPPQSIRIGQTWYSYSRVEPFATQIAATVDLLTAAQASENGLDTTKAIGSAYEHLVSQLQDKTFARGISDVLQAIQDGSSTIEWAGNFATSWVPNIIRASARESDDDVRETRTWGKGTEWAKQFGERVAYKALPLAGNAPPAKVDLWGRDIEKDKGMTPATDWVWRLVTPVKEQSIKNVASLDRLITNWNNEHPNDVFAPEAPQPVWSIHRDGKPHSVYMTDLEYNRFLKLAGRASLARLEAEGLDTEHPREADIEKIAKVLTRSRKEARARVWQERMERRVSGASGPPVAPPASRAQ